MRASFTSLLILFIATNLSAQTAPQKATQLSRDEVAKIFSKSRTNSGLEYEEHLFVDSYEIVSKVKLKNNKIWKSFKSDNTTFIMIYDGEKFINYDPKSKTGTSSTMEFDGDISGESLYDTLEGNVVYKGKEKIDNEQCLVFSGTTAEENCTMWISEKYGIMMKAISGSKKIIELKNVKPIKIEDSLFRVPSGITITDTTDQIKNYQEMMDDPELEKEFNEEESNNGGETE